MEGGWCQSYFRFCYLEKINKNQ